MRRPRRARNLAVLTLLLGVASFVAAITMGNGTEVTDLQVTLGIVGVIVGILGFILTIFAQVETVRYHRLVRGENVLARWRVDADRWRAFVQLNDSLNAQPYNEIYSLSDTGKPRDDGVEVIIAQESLMVDGDFHSLPIKGGVSIYGPHWIEGPPPCLEFLFAAPSEPPSSWAVRIPIATGAEQDAVMVCEYYRTHRRDVAKPRNMLRSQQEFEASQSPSVSQQTPEERQRLARMRNIALVVAAVAAAAFAVGMSIRERTDTVMISLVMAVSGVMTCLGALVLALVWHLRSRRP